MAAKKDYKVSKAFYHVIYTVIEASMYRVIERKIRVKFSKKGHFYFYNL